MHMTSEELLEILMELAPEERPAVLDEACAGDPELRQEVARLMALVAKADAYFTRGEGAGIFPRAERSASLEKAGDRVGPYKLLQQIGEGGFGVVWMAEQEKPISRRVAIKVIKAGMDSKEVLSRFDAERQALARMEHPNIARVIDAGVTEAGRPYFAMDLVKGVPVTTYCTEHELDVAARLALFSDICAAISHAHQKGVIHRDIKPNNILVTKDGDKPVVKVIDFGISKAIEGKLTDQTLFTRIEQWVGTPAYMSPEQAGLGSLDIDTRSDIYSLGVVLYELLTGVPPFEQAALVKSGMEEMRRIIREVEPPRPSVRMSSMHGGKGKSLEPGRLWRTVDSDLDWIVMKAIDKSRDRRYPTAVALAEDVARYLADEPVNAKPPGTFYLFGKFSKRHRRALRVAAAVGLMLVATTLFSSWQAIRATKAEELARRRLDEVVNERNAKTDALRDAEQVSRLLTEVFKRPNPEMDGRTVTVVEALDAASGKLDTELAAQPERLALLQEVLAGTYDGLALYEKSLELREKVLEVRRRNLGIGHPDSLRSLRQVIENAERLGQFPRVRELAEEEMALVRSHPGSKSETVFQALRSLANACFQTGDRAKAIAVQQEVIELSRVVHGELSDGTAVARWQLTQYTQPDNPARRTGPASGKPETSVTDSKPQPPSRPDLQKAEEDFAKSRANHGASHLLTLEAQSQLAELQLHYGMRDLGIGNQIQLVALAQKEFTPLSETVLQFQDRLAHMYYDTGQQKEASQVGEQLVSLLRERDGADAPSTLDAEGSLERFLFYSDQPERYLKFLRAVYERRKNTLGPENVHTLSIQQNLMLHLLYYPEFKEAITHGEQALPIMRNKFGPGHRTTLDTMCNLGRCYAKAGRTREAIDLLTEACPLMRDDTWVNFLLANLQVWSGLREEYNTTRRWMIDWLVKFGYGGHFADRTAWMCCIAPLENEEQGRILVKKLQWVQAIRDAPGAMPDPKITADVQADVRGLTFYRLGEFANALEQFEKAARVLDSDRKADPKAGKPKYGNWAGFYKALTLLHLGRESEAQALFREAAKDMKSEPSQEKPLLNLGDSDGTSLVVWLAYREAKKIFEPAATR